MTQALHETILKNKELVESAGRREEAAVAEVRLMRELRERDAQLATEQQHVNDLKLEVQTLEMALDEQQAVYKQAMKAAGAEKVDVVQAAEARGATAAASDAPKAAPEAAATSSAARALTFEQACGLWGLQRLDFETVELISKDPGWRPVEVITRVPRNGPGLGLGLRQVTSDSHAGIVLVENVIAGSNAALATPSIYPGDTIVAAASLGGERISVEALPYEQTVSLLGSLDPQSPTELTLRRLERLAREDLIVQVREPTAKSEDLLVQVHTLIATDALDYVHHQVRELTAKSEDLLVQVKSLVFEKVAMQIKLGEIDAQHGKKKSDPNTPSSATKSQGRFSMGATPKKTPKK